MFLWHFEFRELLDIKSTKLTKICKWLNRLKYQLNEIPNFRINPDGHSLRNLQQFSEKIHLLISFILQAPMILIIKMIIIGILHKQDLSNIGKCFLPRPNMFIDAFLNEICLDSHVAKLNDEIMGEWRFLEQELLFYL